MKGLFTKIGKTGKIISAAFGFVLICWGIYEKIPHENIEGEWHITFEVEQSSYKAYIGETHTQKVFFIQSDDKVTGDGEKWEYNGKLLDFSAHRKLEYEGTVDGCRVL